MTSEDGWSPLGQFADSGIGRFLLLGEIKNETMKNLIRIAEFYANYILEGFVWNRQK